MIDAKQLEDRFENITVKNCSLKIRVRILGEGQNKILFFHGFPGSSKQIEAFRLYVDKYDLQVFCYDRPGYGGSDINPQYDLMKTVDEVEALIEHFKITVAHIFTVSGGTPYGLTAAQHLKTKIGNVIVVCGLGPLFLKEYMQLMNPIARSLIRLAPYLPAKILTRIVQNQIEKRKGHSQKASLINMVLPKSAADAKVLENQINVDILNIALSEAFSQNAQGPLRDSIIFKKNWGWDLNHFRMPIIFWHGLEDHIIPHKMAEMMSQNIPRSELKLIPNEGHYSLVINRMDLILSQNFEPKNNH